MRAAELCITKIGNSRGIRLPARILKRYRIGKVVLMEERPDEIALRPKRSEKKRLSWKETFLEMAREKEDWSEWDAAAGDGLSDL